MNFLTRMKYDSQDHNDIFAIRENDAHQRESHSSLNRGAGSVHAGAGT